MKAQVLNIRGSQINKLQFSEIEPYLEDKGMDVMSVFNTLADENEFIYVSNGFLRGLRDDNNDSGEWHHYFTKDADGNFLASKLQFN